MDKRSRLPALLPCLDPEKGASYLKISSSVEAPSTQGKPLFPFLLISDSSPLLRVIEAQWVTDADSEVRRVFLLVQKDQYTLKRDELWPLANPDIDDTWQKAFSWFSGDAGNSSLMILSDQVNERGGLRPFQSLFYCIKRKIYFPPPCPKCGLPLERCDDEDILIRSGLQPYLTSLKRYLFCPACLSEGYPDFYVSDLESDDPPQLKDRWALTREFGALIERKNPATHFPCLECRDRQACYGSDQEALSRIIPFSFYPFFLLIHGAASINAVDFLALLSGASFDEIEGQLKIKGQSGRTRCLKRIQKSVSGNTPFLFRKDKKWFLEILYLKLSFLGQLIQVISSRAGVNSHPDLRLSMDRIWIDLKDPESLLPFFWNFNVEFIDIISNPMDSQSFPLFPASRVLCFSGLAWFFTLLVNRKQNISQVYRLLGEEIKRASPVESFWSDKRSIAGNTAFLPENIFWDPEGKRIDGKWGSLWERSLGLGLMLLNSSLQNSPQWSKEVFSRELEALREEVKKLLFPGEPENEKGAEVVQRGSTVEDKAIHAIMMEIIHQSPPGHILEKEELKETVILSPLVSTPARAQKFEDEERTKTVILSNRGPDKEKNGLENFPETVILPPSSSRNDVTPPSEMKKWKDEKEPAGDSSQDDFFAETVILGPTKAPEKKDRKNG